MIIRVGDVLKRFAAMPRAAAFGRIVKGMKISGACGMRSCYGSVGPPQGHAPGYWRSIFLVCSFLPVQKRTKKGHPRTRPSIDIRTNIFLITQAAPGAVNASRLFGFAYL